jgi:hypothetical protein
LESTLSLKEYITLVQREIILDMGKARGDIREISTFDTLNKTACRERIEGQIFICQQLSF